MQNVVTVVTEEVNFRESDLREAIEVSIRQVKWYDKRLDESESRSNERLLERWSANSSLPPARSKHCTV